MYSLNLSMLHAVSSFTSQYFGSRFWINCVTNIRVQSYTLLIDDFTVIDNKISKKRKNLWISNRMCTTSICRNLKRHTAKCVLDVI